MNVTFMFTRYSLIFPATIGTSICGVSAIPATAPVIEAEEDEVSYAVACITLSGLIARFVYPYLAHALFGAAPRLAGIFLGTAIHDTSQVAGAAEGGTRRVLPRLATYVPLFVVGFLGTVVLRTAGDCGPKAFGVLERATWTQFLHGTETVAVVRSP